MATNYRASAGITITLASLATSSGLTVGRCSGSYSNATNKDDGLVVTLKTRTGTSPTAGGQIEVWAFAQRADGTWPELFSAGYTGADGGFTITSRDILFAGARLVGSVINDATTGRDYVIQGRDLAALFGYVPQQVAFFVAHSTAVSLDSTGANHALTAQPAYLN